MELSNSSNKNIQTKLNCHTYLGYIAISLGIMLAGYFIKQGFINFKMAERTVSVKGIAERVVTSDLAVWRLDFKNSSDNLLQLNTKMAADRQIIISFLKEVGFVDEEIKTGERSVIDKISAEYGDVSKVTSRYIIKDCFIVTTSKINLITKALSQITSVIEKGVIISGVPAFYYTKFFELRPEMLAEATKSARVAALQFANDSDAKVGRIKTANQGLFTINAKQSFGENYSYGESSSIEKKIRVVNTVTFTLE